MQVTNEDEEVDPWEDPEALEALRKYLRVVWRVFERLEKEEAERRRQGLPPLEDLGMGLNDIHTKPACHPAQI